jgi:hypothetical protein
LRKVGEKDVELWFAHAADGRAVLEWKESDGGGFPYDATHSAISQSGWVGGHNTSIHHA